MEHGFHLGSTLGIAGWDRCYFFLHLFFFFCFFVFFVVVCTGGCSKRGGKEMRRRERERGRVKLVRDKVDRSSLRLPPWAFISVSARILRFACKSIWWSWLRSLTIIFFLSCCCQISSKCWSWPINCATFQPSNVSRARKSSRKCKKKKKKKQKSMSPFSIELSRSSLPSFQSLRRDFYDIPRLAFFAFQLVVPGL